MLTHAEMSSIGERILQEYIDTFNIGSALDWARKLHYPHVRMAGGNVQIWDTPEAYAADNDKDIMRTGCAWGKTVRFFPVRTEGAAYAIAFCGTVPLLPRAHGRGTGCSFLS